MARIGNSNPLPWLQQSSSGLERTDPHLRVLCLNVFVRDIDRSLRFYLDQLGFVLAYDARLPTGERSVAVAPPDGTALLALLACPADSNEYKFIGRRRLAAFVTDNVMAKFEQWRNAGVCFEYPPKTEIWGSLHTQFEDPDGNSFALVSHDAVSEGIEAQRRDAAEKLEQERRISQELEIATQVQARLFPQMLPPMKTLQYAGVCVQARQVGGDYFDFLDLGKGRLGLVIGDISGKGIAAALLMAHLQANLRSQCALASDHPKIVLRSVNRLFCENTADSAYATLFFADYDDQLRRLRYVNCGHLPGLLLHGDNTLEKLDSTATVLGLFKAWDCSIEERQFLPGDMLVLYTDGVTESFNDAQEEFGEERLIEALRKYRQQCPDNLFASLISELKEFSGPEQQDDITLIVAQAK